MATENTGNQSVSSESFKDLKIRLDKVIPSPEDRAAKVYELIESNEMPIWDIVCFCMVFLTKAAVMLEFLKPFATELHKLVYLAHYKAPYELGILPKENVIQPE